MVGDCDLYWHELIEGQPSDFAHISPGRTPWIVAGRCTIVSIVQ